MSASEAKIYDLVKENKGKSNAAIFEDTGKDTFLHIVGSGAEREQIEREKIASVPLYRHTS